MAWLKLKEGFSNTVPLRPNGLDTEGELVQNRSIRSNHIRSEDELSEEQYYARQQSLCS